MKDRDQVRPTRVCLRDLGVAVPSLRVMLHELEHPLVVKAQATPAQARAGGGERIRSLDDRVWFKVKTASYRGAAGQVPPLTHIAHTWWLTAGGDRVADSPQHDFYARLAARAAAQGGSDFLLPTDWDRDRLLAEAAEFSTTIVQNEVLLSAADSLTSGEVVAFTVGDREVRVRIRMLQDQRVYLAIGATGSLDTTFLTVVFSAIPGLTADDWMPEPSNELGFDPAPGEILWSAMISPDCQQELLERADAIRG